MLAALTILMIKENKKALHLAQTTTLQRPQEAGPRIQQRPLETVWLVPVSTRGPSCFSSNLQWL